MQCLKANLTRLPRLTRAFSLSAYGNQSNKFEYSYANNQYGKLDLIGSTIGQRVDAMATERPNETALKFCLTQQAFSFLELKQRVDELAQNLLNMGFVKGLNLNAFNVDMKCSNYSCYENYKLKHIIDHKLRYFIFF